MNYLKLNVFWLIFVYGTLTSVKSTTSQPRIIGGEKCIYEEVPYIIQIFVATDRYSCVGSLISMEWILTAAHCIEQDLILKNSTFARSGFHYYNITPQIRYVKRGISYEKYDNNDKYEPRYDIGLMLVYSPFDETSVVKSGTLPRRGFSQGCTEVIAAGTGTTEIYANYTPRKPPPRPDRFNKTLFCVDLPVTTTELCKEKIGPKIDKSVICTMSNDKKGFCKGDSGGPLICKGVIIGVIAMYQQCATPNVPSMGEAVESYLNFIAETANIGTYVKSVDFDDVIMQSSDSRSHTTRKIFSYVAKGNSNLGVVTILLMIGVFITVWM